jgi:hypothetical protein
MLRKMLAAVMFLNPNDLNRGSAELIDHDFDLEYLGDWIDDYSPAVWVNARSLSELDDLSFFDWMENSRARWRRRVGNFATQTAPSWAIVASWHRRS